MALGFVAVALVARVALGQALPPRGPLLLFVAVMASAWYGGLGPGLLATLLGAVLASWLFFRPSPTFVDRAWGHYLPVVEFLLGGVFVSWLAGRLQAAGHAQRRSEERARRILDSLPAHVALLDGAGNVVQVNSAWEGFARANGDPAFTGSGIGSNYFKVCRNAARQGDELAFQVEDGLRRVLDGSLREFSIEYPCHSPTEQRWFLLHATPLSGGEGVVCSHVPVTELKRVGEELRQSEERLRLTMEATGMGIWYARGGSLPLIDWSARLKEMWGLPADVETTPDLTWSLIHPDDREMVQKAVAGALDPDGDGRFVVEHRICRPDGATRWVQSWGQTTFEGPADARRPTQSIGIVLDVTERKLVDRAVRESQAQLQLMADSLPVLISYFDTGGRYQFNNAAYENWFGLAKEAYKGRHMREVIGDAAYEVLRGDVEAALGGEARSFETRLPYQGVGTRDVHVEYVPHRDGDGRVLGFYALIMDVTDRRRAEEALRESEGRLKLALAASHMGVWEWDVRTGAAAWSPECYEITGLETFGGTFEAFQNLLHPDDVGRVTEAVEQALAGRSDFAAEFRVVRPGGEVRWLSDVGRACYDPAGRPERMVGTVQDVTERKDAEAALRESERRWRDLAEAMPQLVWTCAADGACDFLSRQWLDYTGQSEVEQLGYGWREQVHPDDRDGLARAWREAVVNGRLLDAVFRIRRADGAYRWFETRAVPVRGAGGQVVRWYGSNTDIEDLKVATEALRESESRLRSIVSTAADAIVTIDERGRIESVNPAAERMFGYTSAEMVGQNVKMLMPSPYREEHDQYLDRYLRTAVRSVIGVGREVQAVRKGGTAFAVDLTVSETTPLRLFTGILRDISRRRYLEREVLQIAAEEQRRIGQELHDGVGQELTGLSLMADALVERLEITSPDEVELAAKVLDGLGRVHRQVRALSRGLVPVEVDPEGLRAALEELAFRTEDQSGVRCTLECDRPIEVADRVTATHLFRIAQEAVSNALRHGRPRNIRIALRGEDGSLTLDVEDDGVGLARRPEEGEGLGIRLMGYRAGTVGGRLTVGPAVRGGTAVRCTVPTTTGAHRG